MVKFFGPSDSFILPAVMLDAPYLVTGRLLDECRILLWPAPAFRAQVRASEVLAYGATLLLSSYWRTLIGQIKDLKLLSVSAVVHVKVCEPSTADRLPSLSSGRYSPTPLTGGRHAQVPLRNRTKIEETPIRTFRLDSASSA